MIYLKISFLDFEVGCLGLRDKFVLSNMVFVEKDECGKFFCKF